MMLCNKVACSHSYLQLVRFPLKRPLSQSETAIYRSAAVVAGKLLLRGQNEFCAHKSTTCLLGSTCKPKSTKKRIVSPLFSSSLYQGLIDQDTCCSCCWYLCSSDSAVVVTLHIDMFSLSCRVLDIQGCNTLCVHVTQVLDSLVYGFGVLWADGYKYKVIYSSRFFGYRYGGL